MWTLALLAGVAAYAALAGDRLPQLVAGLGVAGCAVTTVALAGRWPSLLPWGIVGVGAAYALFLGLHSADVDAGAPAVAAAVFAGAELGFWSIERRTGPSAREVLVRRVALVGAGALATALIAAVLLVLVAGTSGGLGLEAVGVAAAVATLTIVTLLAARSRGEDA